MCHVGLTWGSPPAAYISSTATNYGSLSQVALELAERGRYLWRQEDFPSRPITSFVSWNALCNHHLLQVNLPELVRKMHDSCGVASQALCDVKKSSLPDRLQFSIHPWSLYMGHMEVVVTKRHSYWWNEKKIIFPTNHCLRFMNIYIYVFNSLS